MDEEFFTLVFRGDLRKLRMNPFKTETPFGIPIAAGIGNAFSELEDLVQTVERLESPRRD